MKIKIKINKKNFLKLFLAIFLIINISTNENKISQEEFLNIDLDTNEKGIMTRQRYEILKANSSFEVMPYEQFLQIFGEIDFNERKKSGEITHKQELVFLAENNIEEISYKENQVDSKENTNLSNPNINLRANNLPFGQTPPINHDSRTVYPDCFVNIIRNQENCGGCW